MRAEGHARTEHNVEVETTLAAELARSRFDDRLIRAVHEPSGQAQHPGIHAGDDARVCTDSHVEIRDAVDLHARGRGNSVDEVVHQGQELEDLFVGDLEAFTRCPST